MNDIKTIGFIGLGLMGGSFAKNILKAGIAVNGYDPSPIAATIIENAGGKILASPKAIADGSQLVIIMVPDVPQIEDVLTGKNGLLSIPGAGRIIMVMSTIDPGAAINFAKNANMAGWHYVDCPVGRTGDDARNGNSMFMLGGDSQDKKTVAPILDIIGTMTIDCGELGHGMVIKIVNNFMSTVGAVLTAEALRLANSLGVSSEAALSVVNETIAQNGHSKIHFPNKVLNGDLNPGFAIKHARKDINIACQVLEREGFPSYLGPEALKAYDAAIKGGYSDNDWSAMYEVIDNLQRKAK